MARKKTPTKTLEARGSWRAKQRKDNDVPFPDDLPDPPDWLSEEGRLYWPQIASELYELNLITSMDRPFVALLCDALAQYVSACKMIAEQGILADCGRGGIQQHPAVRERNEARNQVIKIAARFGMSPSDRASLTIEPRKKGEVVNAKERFFTK